MTPLLLIAALAAPVPIPKPGRTASDVVHGDYHMDWGDVYKGVCTFRRDGTYAFKSPIQTWCGHWEWQSESRTLLLNENYIGRVVPHCIHFDFQRRGGEFNGIVVRPIGKEVLVRLRRLKR